MPWEVMHFQGTGQKHKHSNTIQGISAMGKKKEKHKVIENNNCHSLYPNQDFFYNLLLSTNLQLA